MKKNHLGVWILFMLFISCQHAHQNKNSLNFTLYAPNLSADSTVYITGSHALLGNWNPGAVKMHYKGTHTWEFSMPVPTDSLIEYKYTLGSWQCEGADRDHKPLPNYRVATKHRTITVDTVLNWTLKKEKVVKGQITGTVEYHRGIDGFGLLPRDLIVWLPPGYHQNEHEKYPVLYMLDGQNIIDPATSAFGNDWQVDESCDSLIKNNLMEALIIVGIYNTPRRSYEYLPGDSAQLFMNLIIRKIKPLMDRTYRTLPEKEKTWIGGSSAGGTLAFMLAWEHPDTFSKALCMSPAFKIKNIDYVKNVRADTQARRALKFYFDNGGIDLEADLQPGIDEMLQALNEKGYRQNTDYLWVKDPEAYHSELAWAKRFPRAIEYVCNN